MIRVLQVVGKMNFGGAETRLLEIARRIDLSKIHFDFCVFDDEAGDYDDQIRRIGCGIVRCKLTKNVFGFSKRFHKVLQQGSYDVVHCHIYQFSGLPLRIAAKEKVPMRIMHLRTIPGFERNILKRLFYDKLMQRWMERYATNIVGISQIAMVANMGAHWESDPRTRIIYNAIDTQPYSQVPDRAGTLAEFGIPESARVVIHVGNFRPAKDHRTLIKAAGMMISQNKDVHFLLVGSGTLMSEIRELVLVRGFEKNVHFAGARDDVPQLLMSSDCFMFPSRWEGLGGAVLEALAAGLPVVASDIAAMREIASESDRVHLVGIGDSEGFARKGEEILADLEDYKTEPGRIPERFSLDACICNFLALYGGEGSDGRGDK